MPEKADGGIPCKAKALSFKTKWEFCDQLTYEEQQQLYRYLEHTPIIYPETTGMRKSCKSRVYNSINSSTTRVHITVIYGIRKLTTPRT